MMFTKGDFDALPFPRVETLPKKTRDRICKIADQLEFDDVKPWDALDAFIFDLYGLDADDIQVAKDTLFASAAYRKEGRAAFTPPPKPMRKLFAEELQSLLQPFFEICEHALLVREPEFQQDPYRSPWLFLELSRSDENADAGIPPRLLEKAMAEANRSGASRVIVRRPRGGGLLLGLLAQQRWWTVTRARMCGQHILREHLDAFSLEPEGHGH